MVKVDEGCMTSQVWGCEVTMGFDGDVDMGGDEEMEQVNDGY